MAIEEGVEAGVFDHINIPINPNNILLNCLAKTASLALIFSRILPVRIDSFVAKTKAPMPQTMPMSEYCWNLTPRIKQAPVTALNPEAASSAIGFLFSIWQVLSISKRGCKPRSIATIDAGKKFKPRKKQMLYAPLSIASAKTNFHSFLLHPLHVFQFFFVFFSNKIIPSPDASINHPAEKYWRRYFDKIVSEAIANAELIPHFKPFFMRSTTTYLRLHGKSISACFRLAYPLIEQDMKCFVSCF